ncbi:MAG: Holliday junction resolvase RuvX [Mariprofundaceae bacterium]
MTVTFCSTTDFSTSPPLTLPLLALDIGGKRIGVAVCDKLAISVRGVACLFRKDTNWPRQALKLAADFGCNGVVVGLPRNMDGSEGAQAEDCRAAAAELSALSDLPLEMQDERLSSWAAKERLYAQGLNQKKVRQKIDQTAAAVILEAFIAAHPELTSAELTSTESTSAKSTQTALTGPKSDGGGNHD